jgi:hypothetical protein
MGWLKEKSLSKHVQALIDAIREKPERFSIEYCIQDSKHTHVQLRDVEVGYERDAWIYINSGGNWYKDLYIGGAFITKNLANALTEDEIEAIYQAVKIRVTLLRYEEKETLLDECLGKYVSK